MYTIQNVATPSTSKNFNTDTSEQIIVVNESAANNNYAAHAEGYQCIAAGQTAHAEGRKCIAWGNFSHAEGSGQASANYAHAKGSACKACAHAKGVGARAYGINSHAEGSSSAGGNSAHAEGNGTRANGDYSPAEGNQTYALGKNSHAGGSETTARGLNSFAIGDNITTYADADCAFVAGYYTDAEAHNFVIGKYNKITDAATPSGTSGDLFVVGNGVGSATASRSNAFRIIANGYVYATRSYSSSGADYAEMFEWVDGNPEAEDRWGYFAVEWILRQEAKELA